MNFRNSSEVFEITNVTTKDIELLWQLAFSKPAKAMTKKRISDTPDNINARRKNIAYKSGDLSVFAETDTPDLSSLGMDVCIGQRVPGIVSRILMQYTGLDLTAVKDYDWREAVQEAYNRAGIKLAPKDDGMMQTMVFAVPSVIRDPSGFYLSRFLIGHELTRENMTDSMRWIHYTGKSLENLAEMHRAYNRLKD